MGNNSSAKSGELSKWLSDRAVDQKAPQSGEVAPLSVEHRLVAILQNAGWKSVTLDKSFVRMAIKGDHSSYNISLFYDGERRVLTILAFFHQVVQPEQFAKLYEFGMKFNERCLLFSQIDIGEKGSFCCKTYAFMEPDQLDSDKIANLLNATVRTIDRCYPPVMGILFGGKSPDLVIEELLKK